MFILKDLAVLIHLVGSMMVLGMKPPHFVDNWIP